jgi:N-acetyltransferase 10
MLTPFDLKRMESYSNNMLDYHVVLDLLPTIASLYFTRRLGPEVSLAAAQQAILLALGLQRKSIEDVEAELRVPVSQGLALFVKVMRKVTRSLRDIQKSALAEEIPEEEPDVQRNVNMDGDEGQQGTSDWRPMATTVEEDLEEVVDEETKRAKAMQRELIDSMDLSK